MIKIPNLLITGPPGTSALNVTFNILYWSVQLVDERQYGSCIFGW